MTQSILTALATHSLCMNVFELVHIYLNIYHWSRRSEMATGTSVSPGGQGSARSRGQAGPATYLALREHHKKAYDFLSVALEIDESGQGMCVVCVQCVCVCSVCVCVCVCVQCVCV